MAGVWTPRYPYAGSRSARSVSTEISTMGGVRLRARPAGAKTAGARRSASPARRVKSRTPPGFEEAAGLLDVGAVRAAGSRGDEALEGLPRLAA